MTQHVLTDAEMHALISGNPFTLGLSIARLKDFIRQVEKAVLAKQNAEHQPFTPRNAAEMREFIGMNFDSLQYANPDTEEPHEMDRYTLTIRDLLSAFSWSGYYDAGERCVSPTSHKADCVSEKGECDKQNNMITPLAKRKIQSKIDDGEYRYLRNATVLVNEDGRAAIVNKGGAFYWVKNTDMAIEFHRAEAVFELNADHIPEAGGMDMLEVTK